MRVGFCYNLKGEPRAEAPPDLYAEFDDPATIDAVRAALAERHEVISIEAGPDAYPQFLETRPEIVFNLAEGIHGAAREAHIPAMLEMLQIPYTGSDPVTLGITLDKRRTREVLLANEIPVPRQVYLSGPGDVPAGMERLGTEKAIVKPVAEGSSKGIPDAAVVDGEGEWTAAVRRVREVYGQAAVVEELLTGREFTAALMGNEEEARVFPLVEIDLSILPDGLQRIYSYEAKWVVDRPEDPIDIFICPAALPEELGREISELALRAYRTLDCRDWSRIDIRLDGDGRPRILEINPLPGILPNPEENSCYPKAARAAGLSYSAMIHAVLDAACKRVGLS